MAKFNKDNYSKLYEVLHSLRIRYNLFLTSKSITALENYLTGYMVFGKWGFYDWNLIYNEGDVDLNEFRFWIQGKPNIPLSSGPRFSKYLLDKCNGDEEKAFDMFYDLLDKFKEHKKDHVDDSGSVN